MSAESQNLRDTLVDLLHSLADDQDQHARSAIRSGDPQRESAHRGAAIGLRMAAAVVSERLNQEAPWELPAPFSFRPSSLSAASLVAMKAAAT